MSQPPPSSKLGKYTILGLIRRGSMGMVYLAHDALLERDVAIKVMVGASVFDKKMRARFESEARAVARLHHPNIITIHDLGYDQNGSPFIAMELLEGLDLDELIDTHPPSVGGRLDIVAQVCRGLAHAHRHGVVHRDVKPANIFVTEDGCAKIMDFGVARMTQTSQTQAGIVVGTAGYMSPEQLRGKAADGRSDIFSLGITLFEILTNQVLFSGDAIETIFFQTLSKPTPNVVMPDGSELPALQKILNRALAKDPEERYWSADEMEEAIRDFLRTHKEVADQRVFLSVTGTESRETCSQSGRSGKKGQPSDVRPSVGTTGGTKSRPIEVTGTSSRRTARAPAASAPSVRPRVPTGRRSRRAPRRGLRWALALVVLLAVAIGGYRFVFDPSTRAPGSVKQDGETIATAGTESPPSLTPTPSDAEEPVSVPPSETTLRERAALLAADAALALGSGNLEEADALMSQGERLDPESPRWSPLREQLRAKVTETRRRTDAVELVREARLLLESGRFQEAIDAYMRAVDCDPQNMEARSELEQALDLEQERLKERQRVAEAPRRFTETETDFIPSSRGPNEMMGFEMEERLGVKETADALLPAQLIIELDPKDAGPGEPYFLQVSVFNEGYRTLEFQSLELVSRFGQKETTGKGQPIPVSNRQVAPQTKTLLHEVTGTWKESQNHGEIEVTVTLTDGGRLIKSVRW